MRMSSQQIYNKCIIRKKKQGKSLMERGLGEFVLDGNTKAYYKPLPTEDKFTTNV